MISCRKAFCHKVASKRQKCEWCFPYERCLSYNFPQLFPQPKLVCGLLEESSFLATRSWNTALKTSPRRVIPDSWLDPILGFSVFLLNYHIFFFEVHVLLDGLPVASIRHVKESTGRFSQCFSLRKVHHTGLHHFSLASSFQGKGPHIWIISSALSMDQVSMFPVIFTSLLSSPAGTWSSTGLKSDSKPSSLACKTSFPCGVP